MKRLSSCCTACFVTPCSSPRFFMRSASSAISVCRNPIDSPPARPGRGPGNRPGLARAVWLAAQHHGAAGVQALVDALRPGRPSAAPTCCCRASRCLLFWQWRPIGGVVWNVENAAARALYAGFAFGWGLVLVTTFLINHFDLFGLRQVWLHFRGDRTGTSFRDAALYRLVRHPLYVGWLFAFWARRR